MNISKFIVSVFLSGQLSLAALAEGVKSREWLDEQWSRLQKAPDISLEEQLNSLQWVLRGVGPIPPKRRSSEEQQLYRQTQHLLTSTPGHAHYYRDLILEAKNKAFTNGQLSTEPAYSNYTDVRMYALLTLSYLPSLETMEVLSDFLDDQDKPANYDVEPDYFYPLCQAIPPALKRLIQEDPQKDFQPTARPWRDEVRAGRLTFRFKGSDKRYNFEGRVADKAPRPEKSQTSSDPLSSPMTGDPDSSSIATDNATTSSRNVIIACSALFLLVALAWWARTNRKP